MQYVYFGTYTRTRKPSGSKGIYVYTQDTRTGLLAEASTESSCSNPSFITVCPANGCLYAGSEEADSSAVFAYRINPQTGALQPLNSLPSIGTALCHLCVDRGGRLLFASHYMSGNITVFSLNKDGSLDKLLYNFQHEGKSVNPQRQEGPHAHSVTLSPDESTAYAADLGTDKLVLYRVDKLQDTVQPDAEVPFVAVDPGEGPRHLAFHPNDRYLYLATEMGNSVIAYACQPGTGALTQIQKLSTLPADFNGTSYAADIHLSQDGRHLYVSNRGHDSIALFEVDPASGLLSGGSYYPSRGKFPRNFGLNEPYCVVANQVVVYRISAGTGALEEVVQELNIPVPVCVAFYKA
ncbi:MAG: lactonase family protein [Anaerolineae bacterium]